MTHDANGAQTVHKTDVRRADVEDLQPVLNCVSKLVSRAGSRPETRRPADVTLAIVNAFAYLTAVVLAVIAIGVGTSAPSWNQRPFTGPSPSGRLVKLSQFTDSLLRFDYPSSWTPAVLPANNTFSTAVVFLSHEADPRCAAAYGITVSIPRCALGSDGVLVEWSLDGFPGWTLARVHGQRVLVDGRPGKESFVSGSQSCATGTEEGVILVVSRTVPDSWYDMDACLRGPDLAIEGSEIQAMIASTKILQP